VVEGHTVQWLPCVVDGDAHAGRAETSLLMHLAPSLVRRDRLEAGNTTALVELLPDLRALWVQRVSPNGVLGDPRDASAAEGARLFARMLETARRGL
jgi:creatinine amidohydrolase/Fe(II)-dependent formamide hydrolase-like protein